MNSVDIVLQLHCGRKAFVFHGIKSKHPLFLKALNAIEIIYSKKYGNIQKYLEREESAMDPEKKTYFVVTDKQENFVGCQFLYGNGPSPVPSEIFHPDLDLRAGSQNLFEVKRAVGFGQRVYFSLMEALALYFLDAYGSEASIPVDHAIIGYTREKKIHDHLVGLGFSSVFQNEEASWMRLQTTHLVRRYRKLEQTENTF